MIAYVVIGSERKWNVWGPGLSLEDRIVLWDRLMDLTVLKNGAPKG